MTFILTAICVESIRAPETADDRLFLRPVPIDQQTPFRAGFVPALVRFLPGPTRGQAYYIVTDEGGGYETSNVFASYQLDEDDPVRLTVPAELHPAFERCLTDLLAASSVGKVVLVFEFNGNVTGQRGPEASESSVDVVGPMPVAEFWWRLRLGELVEDSIIQLERG